jgi:hypothetical protein
MVNSREKEGKIAVIAPVLAGQAREVACANGERPKQPLGYQFISKG